MGPGSPGPGPGPGPVPVTRSLTISTASSTSVIWWRSGSSSGRRLWTPPSRSSRTSHGPACWHCTTASALSDGTAGPRPCRCRSKMSNLTCHFVNRLSIPLFFYLCNPLAILSIIITQPYIYPTDFAHLSDETRMHEAVMKCLRSRYGRLQFRGGRHTWQNGERYCQGLLPDGPERLVFLVEDFANTWQDKLTLVFFRAWIMMCIVKELKKRDPESL
jgi:hypothetical protein